MIYKCGECGKDFQINLKLKRNYMCPTCWDKYITKADGECYSDADWNHIMRER